MEQSWNDVIFAIYFLNYILSNTFDKIVRWHVKECTSIDLILNTCGICYLIWCANLSANVEGDKSQSNLPTVSKFFTLQRGKQRWHPSPWLMNMAENQFFTGASVITDNNNYAMNLSLATGDNRGKQDFCEQWAFRQPAVGKLAQVPDWCSHLWSYHRHQTLCVCPIQSYNNPTTFYSQNRTIPLAQSSQTGNLCHLTILAKDEFMFRQGTERWCSLSAPIFS